MNCLHDLESNGFAFRSIATDRNSQIAKWLRENRSSIQHCFDCWHFSKKHQIKVTKTVQKKRLQNNTRTDQADRKPFVLVSKNCKGDPETCTLVTLIMLSLIHI